MAQNLSFGVPLQRYPSLHTASSISSDAGDDYIIGDFGEHTALNPAGTTATDGQPTEATFAMTQTGTVDDDDTHSVPGDSDKENFSPAAYWPSPPGPLEDRGRGDGIYVMVYEGSELGVFSYKYAPLSSRLPLSIIVVLFGIYTNRRIQECPCPCHTWHSWRRFQRTRSVRKSLSGLEKVPARPQHGLSSYYSDSKLSFIVD